LNIFKKLIIFKIRKKIFCCDVPTDAQNGVKTENSNKADEFTQTTVALIVVIAVTLTLVLCLVVAMTCLALRIYLNIFKKLIIFKIRKKIFCCDVPLDKSSHNLCL
jgi:hypothetical protein